ncbi:MAG: 5'/3'-nucleotidase SurE [Phycisphaeraceae bacterium]
MRILVTNDDGIHAPGIAALYRAVRDLGEVHVVAPAKVQSATSHAVTFHRPLPTRRQGVTCLITEQSFEGIAVEGRPADCVKLGLLHLVPGPVDLVVSGINSGANVGINTIYSGTVAAAREAAFMGIPSIAISLHIGDRDRTRWNLAEGVARDVVRKLLATKLQPHALLNVNIPNLDDRAEPRGVRVVPVSTSPLLDRYDISTDAAGATHYHAVEGFQFQNTPPDSDVDALFEGYVTVTPMHFDPTRHEALEQWSKAIATLVSR